MSTLLELQRKPGVLINIMILFIGQVDSPESPETPEIREWRKISQKSPNT